MPPSNPYNPNNSDAGPAGNPYEALSGQTPEPAPGSPNNPYAQPAPSYGGPASYQGPPPQAYVPLQAQQPPAPQPTGQPPVPYFLDPNGPYGPLHYHPPVKKRKPKKLMYGLIGGGVVVLIGIVVSIVLGGQGALSPDEVFQAALQHSLATTSFTETTSVGKDTHGFRFDLSDNSDPKMNSDIVLTDDNLSFGGYGDLQDTFAEFTKTDGTNVSDSLQNQWIQVRKGGKLPDTANVDDATLDKVAPLVDPQSQLLGPLVRGNFSQADQQSLLSTVQHIYSYNADNATTSVVGGTAVYVYAVTIDTNALQSFEAQAGKDFGLSSAAIDANANVGVPSSATFYISISDQQVVKIDAKNGSSSQSSTFSDINNTKLNSKPVADDQWSDVMKLSAQDTDAKRQSQIGAIAAQLELFYAKYKQYPTFDNLNDSAWLAGNFAGFDTSKLKDPNAIDTKLAATPTANQFAYQPAADKSGAACSATVPCKYYKLTATLNDGTPFSKESAAQ